MFSPFRTPDGTPKALIDITWDDLSQLAELDEGFVLEFKRAYTPSVQKKIPKIIASFANSRGGWLVVGIADDDKSICPIERPAADFSQIIGELCRRHISPTPVFDLRFLTNPDDRTHGVLVLQVEEGNFPPYIADGVVEVREGSTSGPAAGNALVELYDKATQRRAELADFCQRTVYYPTAGRAAGCRAAGAGVADAATGTAAIDAASTPLFDLYLPRMARRGLDAPSRAEINAHIAAMRASFAQQGMTAHVQHAHDSRIIRSGAVSDASDMHSAIELFGDESMKLSVPAILLTGAARKRAIESMRAAGLTVGDSARLIDASATLRRVTRMASLLDRYVRMRNMSWQQYAVAYQLEHMAGVMLWSDEPLYLDYIRTRGALFCGTTDCVSRTRYLDDGDHDAFRARQFAGSHFFEACGLPLGTDDPADNALVDALLATTRE